MNKIPKTDFLPKINLEVIFFSEFLGKHENITTRYQYDTGNISLEKVRSQKNTQGKSLVLKKLNYVEKLSFSGFRRQIEKIKCLI